MGQVQPPLRETWLRQQRQVRHFMPDLPSGYSNKIPKMAVEVAKAASPKGNAAMKIRDELDDPISISFLIFNRPLCFHCSARANALMIKRTAVIWPFLHNQSLKG